MRSLRLRDWRLAIGQSNSGVKPAAEKGTKTPVWPIEKNEVRCAFALYATVAVAGFSSDGLAAPLALGLAPAGVL